MAKQQSFTSFTRRVVLAGGAASLISIPAIAKETDEMARSKWMSRAFERERFVADCVAAHRADGMEAVRETLARALSDRAAVLNELGGPTQAGLDVMHSSPDFTIFAAHWTPQMNLLPHDHMMEALIGIYTGREDNIIWKRGDGGIEASEVNCLFEGDIARLPADAIHSVTNPLLRFTGGIHIYDGDFFGTERHQWDPDTLIEEPSDGGAIRAMFASENERYFARCES